MVFCVRVILEAQMYVDAVIPNELTFGSVRAIAFAALQNDIHLIAPFRRQPNMAAPFAAAKRVGILVRAAGNANEFGQEFNWRVFVVGNSHLQAFSQSGVKNPP